MRTCSQRSVAAGFHDDRDVGPLEGWVLRENAAAACCSAGAELWSLRPWRNAAAPPWSAEIGTWGIQSSGRCGSALLQRGGGARELESLQKCGGASLERGDRDSVSSDVENCPLVVGVMRRALPGREVGFPRWLGTWPRWLGKWGGAVFPEGPAGRGNGAGRRF